MCLGTTRHNYGWCSTPTTRQLPRLHSMHGEVCTLSHGMTPPCTDTVQHVPVNAPLALTQYWTQQHTDRTKWQRCCCCLYVDTTAGLQSICWLAVRDPPHFETPPWQ